MIRGSAVKQARRAVPIYAILLAIVVVTALLSDRFLTSENMVNVFAQVAPLAIVALGQTIVILLAGIDLSVGSVVSMTTVILAAYSGTSGATALRGVALSLAVGLLVGAVNGLGIVKLRVPPLIMTLGTMVIVKGIALQLLPSPGGSVPYGLASLLNSSWGWVSTAGMLILFLYLVFSVLLGGTRFGRYVYASGENLEAARRSGVEVDRVTIAGYALSGLLAAAGGVLLAARIYSGDPVIGDSLSLDSVAAVVVGGTSLFGGVGGVIGTLAGSIILGICNNVLNMLGVFSFYQYIIKGIILMVALFLYQAGRRS